MAEIPAAGQSDLGRGTVRIDAKTMAILGVRPGQVVQIDGGRKTVAVVDTAYSYDIGLGIIRMDPLLRKNAGTTIGETVKVQKVDAVEAKKITIAPAEAGVSIQVQEQMLSKLLMGRAMVKGDLVQLKSVVPSKKDRFGSGSPFHSMEDLFDTFEGGWFGIPEIKVVVVATSPANVAVGVTENTKLEMLPEAVEVTEARLPEVTYEDIGGLSDEVRRVREMIELPIKHPELFDRLGIDPPKGVLLYGPTGTGKTLLAKAVANESNANFITINGPEVMSKFVGEAEKRLRDVFDEAEKNPPAIIFIDEIDAIAPKREEALGVESRVVAQLLASMDGMKKRGQTIVIAATNRPNALDPALRRAGRFDREIQLGVPDRNGRKEIFLILTRNMPLKDDVDLNALADVTHGFVGADIEGLCKEAAMVCIRRNLPIMNIDENSGKISQEILEKLEVVMDDFRSALKGVEPSAMREVLVEIPKVVWSDIGNLEDAKQELKEAVEWPFKNKEGFTRLGIKPPKGILLYGPPGTGKTLLAKAVANESEANFISVKGPEILSKWVGESEKGIREIFRRARQASPCIIFFDEIDSITTIRGTEIGTKVTEHVVNQLLTEMDGLEELRDVVVIGATNRPDLIDPGLIRAGRFDRHIYVPPPNAESRRKIFDVHTKGMPLLSDVDLDELVKKTENYTGADIASVCREAAMYALRDDKNAKKVSMKHFVSACERVGPSLNANVLRFYKALEDGFRAKVSEAESRNASDMPSYMR